MKLFIYKAIQFHSISDCEKFQMAEIAVPLQKNYERYLLKSIEILEYCGCGEKIIFQQFDTKILTFVYHFPGDEND